MRIRALSVFEGVVYHCYAVDTDHPCRPVLEVEAVTRPGDVDAGPILLPAPDYLRMAGDQGPECLRQLARQGRVVDWQGVAHIRFPLWTPVA